MITDPNRLLAGFVPPAREWRPEFIYMLDDYAVRNEDRANNETQEDLEGSLGGSRRHTTLFEDTDAMRNILEHERRRKFSN
jgi:hypothetical protein